MDGWTALSVIDFGALCGITIAACGLPRRHMRTPEQLGELNQADRDDLDEPHQVDDDAERYGRHAANARLADARVTSSPRPACPRRQA
jgi:hypothetical protein